MPLAPPIENTYTTFEACFADVQALAKREGYAVVAHPKRKNVNGQWARYEIRCDKSGVYKSQARERVRKPRHSKKTDCPFSCSAILYGGAGDPWDFKVNNGFHNHPPSTSPAAHVVHRQDELKAQNNIIVNGIIKGDSVRVIHETIVQSYPGTITRYYDVDNAVQSIKRNHRDESGQFSMDLLRASVQPNSNSMNMSMSAPAPAPASAMMADLMDTDEEEDVSTPLFGRPNTRVIGERRARKVEDRLRVLERMNEERRERLERLEVKVDRIEQGVQRIIQLLEEETDMEDAEEGGSRARDKPPCWA
ncbi:uncharacterized protein BCR38DRAFT_176310 [Pseudomassariella vexata]|uniref:FAR1 domain-containing protein n=1 Tax=Pseudomassariella vexata TaxID=1141098 RepID=A0A1Y2E5X4_9PEZI|nr:uncharacterized protein BCR38DRAFT_176310 [Pseudomassariella vexata]ORY66275.1 hypothetical protein BCR38DRAFT_176310 [Pseudomassariella vexata]